MGRMLMCVSERDRDERSNVPMKKMMRMQMGKRKTIQNDDFLKKYGAEKRESWTIMSILLFHIDTYRYMRWVVRNMPL